MRTRNHGLGFVGPVADHFVANFANGTVTGEPGGHAISRFDRGIHRARNGNTDASPTPGPSVNIVVADVGALFGSKPEGRGQFTEGGFLVGPSLNDLRNLQFLGPNGGGAGSAATAPGYHAVIAQ